MQSEIIKSYSLKIFNKILCRLFIVLGAFLFLQFPLFMYHYKAHLVGHVEELKIQVNEMQKSAKLTQKSIDQYIHKFMTNSDVDFSNQGNLMLGTWNRYKKFSHALYALENANVFLRPIQFIYYVDLGILRTSFASFSLGVSFTYESLSYAILGILSGYALFLLIRKAFRRVFAEYGH